MAAAATTVGIHNDIYRWLIRELSLQRINDLQKRDELDAMLRNQVMKHPYGNILLSFPYLGEAAAATIIGIVKDIAMWPDKKKLKKAMGVYTKFTQSGDKPLRGRRGKEGSRRGRQALFLTCLACIRNHAPENDFRDYYLRQKRDGKVRIKALVNTMGKLSEIIYHCLKNGEEYCYRGVYRTNTCAAGKT